MGVVHARVSLHHLNPREELKQTELCLVCTQNRPCQMAQLEKRPTLAHRGLGKIPEREVSAKAGDSSLPVLAGGLSR